MPRRPIYLNRSDRMALALLALVALAALIILWGTGGDMGHTPAVAADSMGVAGSPAAMAPHGEYTYAAGERRARLTAFDPNTADSTQLLQLGLQPWQVRSIYRYRAHGGVFRRPSDFARLYGLTAGQYRALEPYIRISADYRPAADVYARPEPAEPLARDTLRYPVKLKPTERVALNTADTTLLKRVPGIGSYYARRIVSYRQRLGGYVSVSQLAEIEGMPAEAMAYFTVDASHIQRLRINELTLAQLRRHPYIDYLQARDICDYRRLKGPIASLAQLRLLHVFPEAALDRLRPYIEF